MKRILSIDWDYFIGATATQRLMLFPDGGNENISYAIQDLIWNSRYADPRLKEIGILDEHCNLLHTILRKFILKFKNSFVSRTLVTVSHRWIYDFILQRTGKYDEFEVYNVDFHHDMYCYKTEDQEVNCGNWVNCLQDSRPKMQYYWVKREDSEDTIIGGDKVSCSVKSFEELLNLDFDYVFICRSDCWSPPHLDSFFDEVWKLVNTLSHTEAEVRIMSPRTVSVPDEVAQKYGDVLLTKQLIEEGN